MSNLSRSAVLERRLKIADWIRQHGQMRVDELSAALAVSTVTIRSDLNYLEEQGLLLRSFGKAIAAKVARRPAGEPLAKSLALPMVRLASRLIEADDALLVGHGALPLQIIPLLTGLAGLILVLAGLDAVPLARRLLDCRLRLIGGEIGPDGSSFEGSEALRGLEFYPITHFLMQAETLSSEAGLLLGSKAEERFCTAACRRAGRRIVLVERPALSLESRLSEIPLALVTDAIFPSPPSSRAREVLIAAGLRPIIDEPGTAAHFSLMEAPHDPAGDQAWKDRHDR